MKNLILRAAVPTFVVAVLAALIGSNLKGTAGLVGSILGSSIVIVFFTIGQVMLNRVIQSNPTMAMTVALTMYLVKIGVLFGLLVAFKDTMAFDTKVFALSVLAATLVWTVSEVWAFGSEKVLYVEPGSGPKNL
ncbi:MAG: hypothetical protein RLZZ571_393 [Actinomycetota bacterium]|jgi:ATP synthase protein I